ncbi:DUF5694 domain-containing protein [Qipengyuania sphaerica]|uniref:DUF5694 domain-containing protein n=1 Tax=Qipengyuania sphaerica TaxID=2867243 RepID=UPI001C8A7B8C|nr:DUF5694 domain-containing protein [Qipengyuania sphaerica]MBX7541995.1 hypothetical protein [Qipengyuania sphaerica]
MRNLALLAAAFVAFASPISAGPAEERASDVEVMILGVYHFSSPGGDVVNVEVDDFLDPKRQRELAHLAQTLAQWRPTRIVVEQEAHGPNFSLESYARTEQLLQTERNETVQLGYRLARLLGHEAVYGFDERSRDGEPDYFPFEAVQSFAQRSGHGELLETLVGQVEAASEVENAAIQKRSVAETLFHHNDPMLMTRMHHNFYYSMLTIGDGENQPGAELNAYWYMRNAKMFAKLDLIAEPGDRVLVIVGSGHTTWLRHFIEHKPDFQLVESMPYLIAAATLDDALGSKR